MKRGVGGVKNPSNCHLRKSQSSHGIAVLMNGCDRRAPSNARAYQWGRGGGTFQTHLEHIKNIFAFVKEKMPVGCGASHSGHAYAQPSSRETGRPSHDPKQDGFTRRPRRSEEREGSGVSRGAAYPTGRGLGAHVTAAALS
jgi:hypothetical protein